MGVSIPWMHDLRTHTDHAQRALGALGRSLQAHVIKAGPVTGAAHLEHGPCASFPANWMVRPAAVKSAQPRTLSAAEGHDLVVLMTHGKPGLSRFLEGSVAEDLVSDCPASVLVAR